jgi:WD40 repeat protein
MKKSNQMSQRLSLLIFVLLICVLSASCSHRATLSLVHTLQGHEGTAHSVAFSPDGSLLASGDEDGTIKLWKVADGSEVFTIKAHQGEVLFLTFSADGTLIISGGTDQTLKGWRVTDGNTAWAFEYTGEMKAMLTAGSRMLLATSESPSGIAKLWDVRAGSQIRALEDPCWAVDRSILSMAFTPDGQWLAGAVWPRGLFFVGGCVALWKTGEDFAKKLPGPESLFVGSLTFSPDGRWLAAASLGSVILWEIDDGIIKSWPRFLSNSSSISYSLTFSPDGTLLAVCNLNGTARIWKIPSGEEVSFFVADGCPLAFAPNGQLLASGSAKQESSEKTVKIWRLNR